MESQSSVQAVCAAQCDFSNFGDVHVYESTTRCAYYSRRRDVQTRYAAFALNAGLRRCGSSSHGRMGMAAGGRVPLIARSAD